MFYYYCWPGTLWPQLRPPPSNTWLMAVQFGWNLTSAHYSKRALRGAATKWGKSRVLSGRGSCHLQGHAQTHTDSLTVINKEHQAAAHSHTRTPTSISTCAETPHNWCVFVSYVWARRPGSLLTCQLSGRPSPDLLTHGLLAYVHTWRNPWAKI